MRMSQSEVELRLEFTIFTVFLIFPMRMISKIFEKCDLLKSRVKVMWLEKCTRDFKPDEDSPIVLVWVLLQSLPFTVTQGIT